MNPDNLKDNPMQSMFLPSGTVTAVAALSEQDIADRNAVNGDLMAWGTYEEMMKDQDEHND